MATRSTSSLEGYTRKRRFKVTPEPRPRARASSGALRFVVQKHAASRLHFDFRLELAGTLKSWAVPKGPSLNPSDKRLAVQVEDHPVDYAGFEGKIPAGEYGGGEVILWDEGTWISRDDDAAAALERGKLHFTLKGTRLRGQWHLFRLGGQGEARQPNWFLVKLKDQFASEDGDRLVRTEVTSIRSGKTLEEIAGGSPAGASGKAAAKKRAVPKATRAAGSTKSRKASAVSVRSVPGAQLAPMRDYQPQLCTLVEAVPEGSDWIHELKFDGYRLLAHRDRKAVRLVSRRALDWSQRFKRIADALARLRLTRFVIDGEACALDAQGRPSFQLLQGALKNETPARLVYFAFDLLYADGYDLSRVPLVQRKDHLRKVLGASPSTEIIQFSEHFHSDGKAMHRQVCSMALEGIVSKRAEGLHTPTRSRDWLKIKCGRRQEFLVIGWTPPSGARAHFGSLLLGAHRDGSLNYTGRVGTGFDQRTLADTAKRLRTLKADTSDAVPTMTAAERRGARWVRPTLVAEVAFAEWTADGRLRHPSFEGFREDKDPKDVVIEKPARTGESETEQGPRDLGSALSTPPARNTSAKPRTSVAARRSKEREVVAGVAISNGDRVLFPDAGVTKLQVARYYEAVAPLIMPYLERRPLSTLRCPEGTTAPCFFQKHLAAGFGEQIRRVRINKGEKDYFFIDSAAGLVSLVQFGVLEFHPWASRVESLEKPEFIVFDLDPGEDVGFKEVVAAATHLRDLLSELSLESLPKVSGGKGVHVVVPLAPGAEWGAAKEFAHAMARYMAQTDPDRFTSVMTKSKREGRIFVDYLRNGRGATAISPYSTRARPGAPVAMPVSWKELAALPSASAFTVANTNAHLKKRRVDPWGAFFQIKQSLPAFAVETPRKGRRTRSP